MVFKTCLIDWTSGVCRPATMTAAWYGCLHITKILRGAFITSLSCGATKLEPSLHLFSYISANIICNPEIPHYSSLRQHHMMDKFTYRRQQRFPLVIFLSDYCTPFRVQSRSTSRSSHCRSRGPWISRSHFSHHSCNRSLINLASFIGCAWHFGICIIFSQITCAITFHEQYLKRNKYYSERFGNRDWLGLLQIICEQSKIQNGLRCFLIFCVSCFICYNFKSCDLEA